MTRSSLDSDTKTPLLTITLNAQLADPIRRLQAICAVTREAKETTNAIGARQMTDIQQHIPASTLVLAGRLVHSLALGKHARFCNCIITKVSGSQLPLYKNDAQLLSV